MIIAIPATIDETLPLGMIPMRRPYFDHAANDYVMDEMCQCGHLKSDHGSLLVSLRHSQGRKLRLRDDGSCCKQDCHCTKFRWIRFVYTDEYTQIIAARRKASAVI